MVRTTTRCRRGQGRKRTWRLDPVGLAHSTLEPRSDRRSAPGGCLPLLRSTFDGDRGGPGDSETLLGEPARYHALVSLPFATLSPSENCLTSMHLSLGPLLSLSFREKSMDRRSEAIRWIRSIGFDLSRSQSRPSNSSSWWESCRTSSHVVPVLRTPLTGLEGRRLSALKSTLDLRSGKNIAASGRGATREHSERYSRYRTTVLLDRVSASCELCPRSKSTLT